MNDVSIPPRDVRIRMPEKILMKGQALADAYIKNLLDLKARPADTCLLAAAVLARVVVIQAYGLTDIYSRERVDQMQALLDIFAVEITSWAEV